MEKNFWVHLINISSPNRTLLISSDSLKDTLKKYCMSEELINKVVTKSIAQKKNFIDILKELIVKDQNNHGFVVNTDVLKAFKLNQNDESEVTNILQEYSRILDNNNGNFEALLISNHFLNYNKIDNLMNILTGGLNNLTQKEDTTIWKLRGLFDKEDVHYTEFLQALAETIDYERKAPGDAAEKIKKIERAWAINPGIISALFNDNLSKNIKDSNFIDERQKKLENEIAHNKVLLDPNDTNYTKSWNDELKNSNLSTFYGDNIKRDLLAMGLDTKNAQVLVKQADEFSSFYFEGDSSDHSFIKLIQGIIKTLNKKKKFSNTFLDCFLKAIV